MNRREANFRILWSHITLLSKPVQGYKGKTQDLPHLQVRDIAVCPPGSMLHTPLCPRHITVLIKKQKVGYSPVFVQTNTSCLECLESWERKYYFSAWPAMTKKVWNRNFDRSAHSCCALWLPTHFLTQICNPPDLLKQHLCFLPWS